MSRPQVVTVSGGGDFLVDDMTVEASFDSSLAGAFSLPTGVRM